MPGRGMNHLGTAGWVLVRPAPAVSMWCEGGSFSYQSLPKLDFSKCKHVQMSL